MGANLDANPERARQFLKSRPLGWKQAFLGDWSDTDVPRRYSIASVPAFVLIDPNGRIAAQETSLEAITLKLRDVCSNPARPRKNEGPVSVGQLAVLAAVKEERFFLALVGSRRRRSRRDKIS